MGVALNFSVGDKKQEMMAATMISSDLGLCSDETAVVARACHFPLKRLTGRESQHVNPHPPQLAATFLAHIVTGWDGYLEGLDDWSQVCGRVWSINYLSN
jgi:hypothetical protein